MRVLVVHNRYRSAMPSGENRVVDEEVALLADAGVAVDTYLRSSDEIDAFGPLRRATLAARPLWSPEASRHLRERIAAFRPDVVHLHNPFPLISPQAVRVAKAAGAAVVQTVHNYRHACPSGLLFRDGRVCEDCLGRALPWPAVAHGCYRGSRAQSAVMAAAALAHRGTWQMVDRFLAVSGFVAAKLVDAGLPAERVVVKPNPVPDPGPPPPPGTGFCFAGRLSEEKGVRLLLAAWEASGLGGATTLTLAGDGPLAPLVADAAARLPGLRWLGPLAPAQVGEAMAATAAVVVPSVCYEGLPTAVLEAFARGRPVVATDLGALPELVEGCGWVAPPTPEALAAALRAATDPNAAAAAGARARARYEEHFTPVAALAALLDTYAAVVGSPVG
jgi:glycosyltransferase involved in cell wall biosynthesis